MVDGKGDENRQNIGEWVAKKLLSTAADLIQKPNLLLENVLYPYPSRHKLYNSSLVLFSTPCPYLSDRVT